MFNVILIWEPFKGVVDYVNKEFTKPFFEDLFRTIMTDTRSRVSRYLKARPVLTSAWSSPTTATSWKGLGRTSLNQAV